MGVAVDTGKPAVPGAAFKQLSVNTETGEATVKTSLEELEKAQQAMSFMDNAMVEMQKEGDRIAAQEQQARSRNPVLAALSAVASHLGSQPDMPGFVRGLAGANREMNPDPDMLAMKKLPLYMQVAKLAEEKASMLQRNAQIQQQGTIAQQNADSLALSREQTALSAADRANTTRQATLDRMARGERPLTIKQVLAVDPKMGLEEAQSWVEQSKANHADRQLEQRGKRALVGAQEDAAAALAEERQAKTRLTKARAELTPIIGQARARLYEEHANRLIYQNQIDAYRASVFTEELKYKIANFERLQRSAQERNWIDIQANPMMPPEEKEAFRAKYKLPLQPAGASTAALPPVPQPPAPAPRSAAAPAAAPAGPGVIQRGADFLFGGAREQATTAAAAAESGLPPAIIAKLKQGVHTKLSDGSVWTLENGAPKRIR